MDKEKFLVDLAEILEEETVKESDVLADFEAWDSLSILSIISYVSETYKKQLKNDEIRSQETVEDLFSYIENK
jgi:acyl carrier protein